MRNFIVYQRTLFAIFLICTILLTGCNNQPVEEKQVNIVFRLDDYSARSSTDLELRIIDAFRRNQASITFGVIPFISARDVQDPSPQDIVPLTSMKGDILKAGMKDGILDVALHGYSHQAINTEQLTEFSGLDYDSQIDKLYKGKIFLEGMIDAPVTTFVPPWNKYDLNTLRALEELGFSTLSASKDGESTKDSKLNFLPFSCDLSRLRDAVDAARTSSNNQTLIVVLFHQYDFREIDGKRGIITFQEFLDLLNWLKSKKDVRLLSIIQATKMIKDLSVNRFLLTKRIYLLESVLPSLLKGKGSRFFSLESTGLSKTIFKLCGFYLVILILGMVLSFLIGSLLFQRHPFIVKNGAVSSIVLSAILLTYALYDLQIHPRRMLLSVGIIGISIGLCIYIQYVKNKNKVTVVPSLSTS